MKMYLANNDNKQSGMWFFLGASTSISKWLACRRGSIAPGPPNLARGLAWLGQLRIEAQLILLAAPRVAGSSSRHNQPS